MIYAAILNTKHYDNKLTIQQMVIDQQNHADPAGWYFPVMLPFFFLCFCNINILLCIANGKILYDMFLELKKYITPKILFMAQKKLNYLSVVQGSGKFK